jgi:hypothetical protein
MRRGTENGQDWWQLSISCRDVGLASFGAILAAALFLSTATGASAAGPPVNDLFANPTVLSGTDVDRSGDTNSGATKESGEPDHAGNIGGASVWYRWTAPHSGLVEVDTIGSDFDTLLGVYTGSAVNGLTTWNANDDIEYEVNLQSQTYFPATGGTTYRIAVDGYNHNEGGGPATGAISLHLHQESAPPGPPNDSFATPTVLNNEGGDALIDFNTNASKEPLEPAHAGNPGGASLWYSWTPQVDRLATIETCLSPINTIVGVYTGDSLPTLKEVASEDEGCPEIEAPPPPPGGGPPMGEPAANHGSLVHFLAQAGTTYRIAVDGFNGEQGEIRLQLYTTDPEATPSTTPISAHSVHKVELRKRRRHPPLIRVSPSCDPGRYTAELRVPRLGDDGALVGDTNAKTFRCKGRRAAFLKGSGFFRLPRTWWREAHTKRGITLAAVIARSGEAFPTTEPFWIHKKKSKKKRHRTRHHRQHGRHHHKGRHQRRAATTSASGSYTGTGLSCVGLVAGGGEELLSVSGYFGWGVANLGEWVRVVGWVLPYFPGRGYGGWIRSSNSLQYQVALNGATSEGYSATPNLFVYGGTTWPGSSTYLEWGGRNGITIGRQTWILMGVLIWTQRTGWFFRYVTPENITGTASRSGDWCWYP